MLVRSSVRNPSYCVAPPRCCDVRILGEGGLEVLFEGLECIKWDIIDLNEVRRTGEEFIEL